MMELKEAILFFGAGYEGASERFSEALRLVLSAAEKQEKVESILHNTYDSDSEVTLADSIEVVRRKEYDYGALDSIDDGGCCAGCCASLRNVLSAAEKWDAIEWAGKQDWIESKFRNGYFYINEILAAYHSVEGGREDKWCLHNRIEPCNRSECEITCERAYRKAKAREASNG
jgi:hypothetical protein